MADEFYVNRGTVYADWICHGANLADEAALAAEYGSVASATRFSINGDLRSH